MAYSGNIGEATFNALSVVDHAFRRCRLPAQSITPEMQDYALDSLAFMLDEMANIRPPSWCIEKVILPMYQNQPIIPLPQGTVEVLNLNYRTIQPVSGATTTTSTSYTVNFTTQTTVTTVGVEWSNTSVPLTFQVSTNGTVWITVGTGTSSAVAGDITWWDISEPLPYQYFRITAASTINYTAISLGNLPQEIPLGALNRDNYVNQSNKYFPGRPTNFWFQRSIPTPVVNLWPAPFEQAEDAQLILWRHRAIMDTDNLQQEVNVPNRWLEAIINGLAARVAAETPMVEPGLVPVLEQRAAVSMQRAWDGDNDGSPTYIQPSIGMYTK